MNQLEVKQALKYTISDLLGSQQEMKFCFCPNCCFWNLKVEFGFLLTSQAQLHAVRLRALFQGCVSASAAERLKGTDLLPLSPQTWLMGVGGWPQVHWQLGSSGVGSTPGVGGLTSDGRRGGSDPLLLIQLRRKQVSDTIGHAELGTCHGWGTTIVVLGVQEELAGEDWLHVGHDEPLLRLVWGPWVLLTKAQMDLVLGLLATILQVGSQFLEEAARV